MNGGIVFFHTGCILWGGKDRSQRETDIAGMAGVFMSEIIKKMLSSGIRRFICSSMPGKAVKEGDAVQLSKHEPLEFFFVIRGESSYQIEDKLFDTRPGDLCVIEPWATHASGYRASDHDLCQFWLHLHRNQLVGNFFQVESQGRFKNILPPMFFPFATADMLRKRWQLVKAGEVITEEALNKYLRTPLTFIMEEVLLGLERGPEKTGNDSFNIIGSIKQYIMDRQGCRCSLDSLEEFTGYSKYYISHLFREKTGMTIGKYVNTVRVKYVAEAELHGIPYKEIARQLGFSSVQAFSPWNKTHKKKISEYKEWIQNRKDPLARD